MSMLPEAKSVLENQDNRNLIAPRFRPSAPKSGQMLNGISRWLSQVRVLSKRRLATWLGCW